MGLRRLNAGQIYRQVGSADRRNDFTNTLYYLSFPAFSDAKGVQLLYRVRYAYDIRYVPGLAHECYGLSGLGAEQGHYFYGGQPIPVFVVAIPDIVQVL